VNEENEWIGSVKMVHSMTGFGRSKIVMEHTSVTVEIKTVNHRFSEFYIRMPRQLVKIEDKIKKCLNQYVTRGRIEVFITIEGESLVKRRLNIDWNLIDEYYHFIEALKEKYEIHNETKISHFLMKEDLVDIEEIEEENEQLETIILQAVEEASVRLQEMRKLEGLELEHDFHQHLRNLEDLSNEVSLYAPTIVENYRERLLKKVQEYASTITDESRILTEVALFADKSDITEELTRLKSHIKQFEHILQEKEPVGRKLDFLLQEMNREVNTIGSKGNDSTIAKLVVEMKSVLEKMREQVQNVE